MQGRGVAPASGLRVAGARTQPPTSFCPLPARVTTTTKTLQLGKQPPPQPQHHGYHHRHP
ncbi:hypothetical protein COCVIDRAFT_97136 [Bipolaris victoriae FI3]|uniref:Uncharacterized protein n=2 Tax=Bipolaris TaxID=33194 RepID=W6Y257_COCC2|nr:uncharacterized protein COCCADRAFT_100632 [Bipolaris zeicola 26-R-13]XP_014557440.1 hypothetical protein COCVIDRAFT_97136 [Bipolaris victoriae FI3]EUC31680.1 hypothetical protein COCCADRAFT_100632 [Bipolaris zeicola 26-R-13]